MKLLLIGPSKTGKSTLASFLAGILDSTTPASEPMPTVGVRILEFTSVGVPIELWDVSGDQSYENTWPACSSNADGVILCYSPETAGHAVSERRDCQAHFDSRAPPVPSRPCSLTATPTPPYPMPLPFPCRRRWSCSMSGFV